MDISLHLESWYRTAAGSLMADLERRALSQVLPHYKGEYLVHFGGLSDLSLVKTSPIAEKVHMAAVGGVTCRGVSSLQSHFYELPFACDALDVVVLCHVLEYVKEPRAVLSEIYRSLKPGGQLFLFGFNRLSWWGLESWRRQSFPWNGDFYTSLRVRDWLCQLDYSLVSHKTLGFLPVLKKRISKRSLLYWETVGQFLAPGLGASYFIHVQKQVRSVTPLMERFRTNQFAVGRQYPEATRVRTDG